MVILFSFLLTLFFVLPSPVAAFTFTLGTPSECDNLPLSWTGGTPPFQLLLSPVFGGQQNISIPTSAFKNGAGSFSVQLQISQSTQFLLTMSDATGFNSGGTTPLLTVGASKGGSPCNTTNSVAFTFQANSALAQCRPFDFTGYADAVQPVTIFVFIPGGTAIELNPPVGSTRFSWNTNVIHGTSLMFSMTDSQGRPGGSSDVRIVGVSDDNSCVNDQSPSSTPGAPSPTTSSSTSSSSPTSGSPTPPPPGPSHGISIAAIAGTIIGALLFLAVIITLGLFFLRKKRDSQPSGNVRRFRRTVESEIDLTYDPRQAPIVTPYNVPQNYDTGLLPRPYYSNTNPPFESPFQDIPPQPVTHHHVPSHHLPPGAFQPPSQYYSLHPDYSPENPVSASFYSSGPSSGTEFGPIPQSQSTSKDSMSNSQRKAAMAGVSGYKPSRIVVHTDADDEVSLPYDDGVVELPPQYSERRRVLGVANPTPDSNPGHPPGRFPS